MSKLLSLPLLALALLALAPETAMAHSGHAAGGFSVGFMHPLGGLDHLLAMVAVGLFAWHLGGRALWLVPAAFVATMAIGAAGAANAALMAAAILALQDADLAARLDKWRADLSASIPEAPSDE